MIGTNTTDPIFRLKYALDLLNDSLYALEFNEDEILDLFDSFQKKMITRVNNGEYPKNYCISSLEELARKLNTSSQTRLSQSQLANVVDNCNSTLEKIRHSSEIPLEPEKVAIYIKMINYIATHKAPTNNDTPWMSAAEAKQKLANAMELYLALTLPDLEQRKKELEDGALSEEQIKQKLDELLANESIAQLVNTLTLPESNAAKYQWLLSHSLTLDEYNTHFLEWIEMTGFFEEFDESLPGYFLKKFLTNQCKTQEQRKEYLKKFTRKLSAIRNSLPDTMQEKNCFQLFLRCLHELNTLPREYYTIRQFIAFVEEFISYASSAKNNVSSEFYNEVFSKTFHTLANHFQNLIRLSTGLKQERYDFLINSLRTTEDKIFTLEKSSSQDKAAADSLKNLKSELKGLREDYKAMHVERRLLRSLFTLTMISPLEKDDHDLILKTFADLLITSTLTETTDIKDLAVIFDSFIVFNKKEHVEKLHRLMTTITFLISQNQEAFGKNIPQILDALRYTYNELLTKKFDIYKRYYTLNVKAQNQKFYDDIQMQFDPKTQNRAWQSHGYLKLEMPESQPKVLYTYTNPNWVTGEGIEVKGKSVLSKIKDKTTSALKGRKKDSPPNLKRGLSPHAR